MEIVGSLRLPWVIPMAPQDIQGQRFDAHIPDPGNRAPVRSVGLLLPNRPKPPSGLLTPPSIPGDALSNETWAAVGALDWGRPHSPDRYFVARLGFVATLEDPDPRDGVGDLEYRLNSWLPRLRTWLAAFRVDVQINRPIEFAEHHLVVRTRTGTHGLAMGRSGSGAMERNGLGVISPEEFEMALTHASSEAEPPLAVSLLESAHELLLVEGGARRSVLDSVAATEVALAGYLTHHLQAVGASADDQKSILRTSGVVQLAEAAIVAGCALPVSLGRLKNELANPRNQAAHAGASLDLQTALTALAIAERIVYDVDPPAAPWPTAARRT